MAADRNPRVTEDHPHDRLTTLGNEMVESLEAKPGTEQIRGIVMLSEHQHGGIAVFGFEDLDEARANILEHLAAIFEASGQKLIVAPLGGSPETN